MHPAPSIIVFTTMSGLGYGLAFWLGLGVLDPAAIAAKVAHLLALALIAAGLVSSTLHLGNPQRAWRAFSQWRTSWLSREGVMAVATFVPFTLSAWFAVVEGRHLPLLGLAGAAGAAVTVYCTAMIYASLRAIQAWNTPLTPGCYLAFAAAGGALLATLFAAAGAGDVPLTGVASILLLAAAWSLRIAWRRRAAAEPVLSTPASATGLGALGRVRLFESPHGTDSYLTREMGFRVARKHARKLFVLAIVVGGAVPGMIAGAVLMAGGAQGWQATASLSVACLAFLAGVMVERWLFFAEARHAVMTYYDRGR